MKVFLTVEDKGSNSVFSIYNKGHPPPPEQFVALPLTGAQVENQSTADIPGRPTTQHIVDSICEIPKCPPGINNSSSVDYSREFGSMTDAEVIEVIDAAAVEISDVVVGTACADF